MLLEDNCEACDKVFSPAILSVAVSCAWQVDQKKSAVTKTQRKTSCERAGQKAQEWHGEQSQGGKSVRES